MNCGQKVQVRPASPVVADRRISPNARGTVLCSYRLLRRGIKNSERLDVRMEPGYVVWAVPADEFEPVGEPDQAH